jgi:hypothetical protein
VHKTPLCAFAHSQIDTINQHLGRCINSERLSERQGVFEAVQSNLLALQPDLEVEVFAVC